MNHPMFWDSSRMYEAVNHSMCNGYNSSETLSCRLRSVAFPAQRLKIGIVISAAMSFWNDVVNAGRFLRYLLSAMVLTQILITLENTRPYDFPGPTVSTFLPALTCLIVTPAITGMLLSVLFTIPTGIVSDCRASFVSARAFSAWWHSYFPAHQMLLSRP